MRNSLGIGRTRARQWNCFATSARPTSSPRPSTAAHATAAAKTLTTIAGGWTTASARRTTLTSGDWSIFISCFVLALFCSSHRLWLTHSLAKTKWVILQLSSYWAYKQVWMLSHLVSIFNLSTTTSGSSRRDSLPFNTSHTYANFKKTNSMSKTVRWDLKILRFGKRLH